jgi:glycosyltransferase involved in cell wall biosynthesis
VILGEGPEREALDARVARHGLGGRILLPGPVAEPGAVLARSALFVLASDYEGFPNALCEAMAHGLAVVATDCPVGPREIVRDGVDGLLVPTGDQAALAAALGPLMGDAETRQRLGRAAAAITDRFASGVIVDRWDSVLRDVVRRHPPV